MQLYHFIFEWLAYLVGFSYFRYLNNKNLEVVHSRHRTLLIIAATLGALLGSRLLALSPATFSIHHFSQLLMALQGNKTIVGAILGGILAVELCKKIIGLRTKTGDLFVFPLIAGMIIGRIGCFLDGLHDGTIGSMTSLPWAVDFGDQVLRHPTSLYEIAWLLCIWVFLVAINSCYPYKNGLLFQLFVMFYMMYRFFVGFIQPATVFFLGLSMIQTAALLAAVYYATCIANAYIKTRSLTPHGTTPLRLL